MTFRIDAPIFDDHGEWNDDRCYAYQDALMDVFAASPEGKAIIQQQGDIQWAFTMVYYGASYVGQSPATMSAGDLQEIVFDIFPRKISCQPEAAAELIAELRAFWQFAQREYALPNAAECLDVLDDDAADDLAQELGDSSNFGMAKSFVMMGQQSGFDMTTQEGLNAFMQVYNASLTKNRPAANDDFGGAAPLREFSPARSAPATLTSGTGPLRHRKKQLAKAKRAAKKAKGQQRSKKRR